VPFIAVQLRLWNKMFEKMSMFEKFREKPKTITEANDLKKCNCVAAFN